jgi:dTDP-4-amino-4,6-dideoxygalactose transaminase
MERNESRLAILSETKNYFKLAHPNSHVFKPGETYIPAAKQMLAEDDVISLVECALDFQYASGPRTKIFEHLLGDFFPGRAKPLMVNSGSSANLIAASALSSPSMEIISGMKPMFKGAEVITVACGFPTTVAPIVQNGWVPVFVDVDLKTLNALPESVKAAQTPKTRAVMIAHALGNPYRADLIASWCTQEGLFFIEDCCDALGSTLDGRNVGLFGDLATLSFYPAHHISTGEGGAVVAATPKLRKLATSFRDWGRDCWCEPARDNTCGKRFSWNMGGLPNGYDHKYIYTHLGYNLKASELQASLGISQIRQVSKFIESRRKNWWRLYNLSLIHI